MGEFLTMRAAADFIGNGAIETNRYESEIVDIVRRESVALQRFSSVPATGAPHRYFEQTAIATGGFTDPRNISPSTTGATRVERSAVIKAITGQSNFSQFDVDVTRQQGQFARLEAKDIEDITSGIVLTAAKAVWNGNDTSLTAPTTLQYMGLLAQITTTATCAAGASIVDTLKAMVANMVNSQVYKVKPTAVYLNPKLGDYIDREMRANNLKLGETVVAGVTVPSIETQAGRLPLITEVFVPNTTDTSFGFAAPAGGYQNYFAVVVTEDMIEMPYVHGETDTKVPRIYQLGLLAGLQGQYVGIWYNTVIAKGYAYAHAILCVVRP